METIHAALLEAGSRIAPLASLDEIAGFFQAAAAIGPTAPARATAVAQRLGGSLVDAASMLASILPTLPSMPNVERLLSVLPPCQDMQLGPTRDTCAVCDNGVLEPSQCFITAPLLSAKGLVRQVQLFKRRCSCCHADHYLSYAVGGLRLQRGEQVPYEGCTDARYLHITTSCVWEASLLVDFEAQALNSHTGFSTFMAEYRMKYGGELPFSDDRAHRAFAHAFYACTGGHNSSDNSCAQLCELLCRLRPLRSQIIARIIARHYYESYYPYYESYYGLCYYGS